MICPYCSAEVQPMREKATGYVRRTVKGDAMYDHCNHVFTEHSRPSETKPHKPKANRRKTR